MKKITSILDGYTDNPGVKNSLARLFLHGHLQYTGKLMFLSCLDGMENSPSTTYFENKHGYDPLYHFQLAIDGGASAIVANLGAIEMGAALFAGRIPMILQVNTVDSLNVSKLGPKQAMVASVEDALRLGCCGISYTMYVGSDRSVEMLEEFSQVAEQAKNYGLAVMVRVLSGGGAISKTGEGALDVAAIGAHIAANVGAHIINLQMPFGNVELTKHKKLYKNISTSSLSYRIEHLVENAFNGRRIVLISQSNTINDNDLVNETRSIRDGGAHGSVFEATMFKRELDPAITIMEKVSDIYSVDN